MDLLEGLGALVVAVSPQPDGQVRLGRRPVRVRLRVPEARGGPDVHVLRHPAPVVPAAQQVAPSSPAAARPARTTAVARQGNDVAVVALLNETSTVLAAGTEDPAPGLWPVTRRSRSAASTGGGCSPTASSTRPASRAVSPTTSGTVTSGSTAARVTSTEWPSAARVPAAGS